jgi:cyclopropane fatty-acyl-phospholipid synthase-like methyltransferase
MEDHLIATPALEKGSNVLDAGCGDGYVAIHLAKNGYRVHGIDEYYNAQRVTSLVDWDITPSFS